MPFVPRISASDSWELLPLCLENKSKPCRLASSTNFIDSSVVVEARARANLASLYRLWHGVCRTRYILAPSPPSRAGENYLIRILECHCSPWWLSSDPGFIHSFGTPAGALFQTQLIVVIRARVRLFSVVLPDIGFDLPRNLLSELTKGYVVASVPDRLQSPISRRLAGHRSAHFQVRKLFVEERIFLSSVSSYDITIDSWRCCRISGLNRATSNKAIFLYLAPVY